MKLLWTLLMVSFVVTVLVGNFVRESRAGADDPRAPTKQEVENSGLKTPVPTPAVVESAIVSKEKELKDKEAALQEREERMAIEADRLSARIAELELLHDEIKVTQNKNKEASSEMLKRVIKSFEAMNPKKASQVISMMKDDLAVELLMQMKEKKVATVLEGMEPARAMELASLVASRRPAGRQTGEGSDKGQVQP